MSGQKSGIFINHACFLPGRTLSPIASGDGGVKYRAGKK